MLYLRLLKRIVYTEAVTPLLIIVFSANFILIAATIIALPIGRKGERNDAKFIFGTTGNLTTWSPGFAWFLSWLSPIWTIGGFDSCVHMSEEASNATKAVPYGILMRQVLASEHRRTTHC